MKRLLSKVEIDLSKEWVKNQLIKLYIPKAKSIVNKIIELEKIETIEEELNKLKIIKSSLQEINAVKESLKYIDSFNKISESYLLMVKGKEYLKKQE